MTVIITMVTVAGDTQIASLHQTLEKQRSLQFNKPKYLHTGARLLVSRVSWLNHSKPTGCRLPSSHQKIEEKMGLQLPHLTNKHRLCRKSNAAWHCNLRLAVQCDNTRVMLCTTQSTGDEGLNAPMKLLIWFQISRHQRDIMTYPLHGI